ncbi:YbaB/EbfC family nucleoid-associated protein [Amycolatopsis cynarae]|uniref:YbaB/EbfC family nucleoid-associated protein n=1 Tax=Amycolatopsis cynarae TaxID=2995223 RepID=A0ABY7B601_9PSEU|nr:YbaB/EbfC family nucleoid-associated protein [Amycolatopsis sp. HUAS 11-8]WAL66331.1 YbaB/EbfC family nucleoid-associated protein [Amycolatopsis sp. HUAS 11-8]
MERGVDEVFSAAGPIVGSASADGVTVEVGVGGRLRSVKLTPQALRYGAPYLAETVVATAAKATAKANQRAQQLYAQALGRRGERVAEGLGLTYDPKLLEADDDFDRDWTRG